MESSLGLPAQQAHEQGHQSEVGLFAGLQIVNCTKDGQSLKEALQSWTDSAPEFRELWQTDAKGAAALTRAEVDAREDMGDQVGPYAAVPAPANMNVP